MEQRLSEANMYGIRSFNLKRANFGILIVTVQAKTIERDWYCICEVGFKDGAQDIVPLYYKDH